jgi:hypothetical protein
MLLCWSHLRFVLNFRHQLCHKSGFGGLVVSILASSSRVQTRPKPSDFSHACLPSEGKSNNLPHVPTLGHVKDPSFCGLNYGLLAKFVHVPSLANRGLSRRLMRSASGDDGRNHFRLGHKGPAYIRPRCITRSRINQSIMSQNESYLSLQGLSLLTPSIPWSSVKV